jgi:hypothetical protein
MVTMLGISKFLSLWTCDGDETHPVNYLHLFTEAVYILSLSLILACILDHNHLFLIYYVCM